MKYLRRGRVELSCFARGKTQKYELNEKVRNEYCNNVKTLKHHTNFR